MALNIIEKRRYLREIENNKRRILSLFPKGKRKGLRFTDIKTLIGLNQRKTHELLRSLIDDGFLDKKKGNGARELYFNKFSEYRGEFDIWDLMSRIDEISQKKGKVLKDDMGFMSGLCSVLAYGIPPYEKLTRTEREMVFMILNRIREYFLNLRAVVDGIEHRKAVEKRMKLPKTCKNIIFGEKSGDVDFSALDKLYGDALWNYIFEYYVGIFNMQLSKGYMDTHGLKDLFNILESARKAIDAEVEKKGPWAHNEFPETEVSSQIPERSLIASFFEDDIKSNAFGIMVTPSPRTLREYSDSLGKIIEQQIDLWGNFENTLKRKKNKNPNWNQIVPDIPLKRKRRNYLKIGIVEQVLLRGRPLNEYEEKVIRLDPLLTEVLDKGEINWIVEKTKDMFSRLSYFDKKYEEGEGIDKMKKDKQWFSDEEEKDYKPVERFISGIEFREVTKTKKGEPIIIDMSSDIEPERMTELMKGLEAHKKEFIGKTLHKKRKQ